MKTIALEKKEAKLYVKELLKLIEAATVSKDNVTPETAQAINATAGLISQLI